MDMKKIVLSFIALCAMDVWASLSYSEATTTTFSSMLPESGTITWPGAVQYVIPGQKHVWTITTGTTTVGETTYNTLRAVRKSGLMIIIAGSTEATIEDQSQEAQLSRNYGCLSLV